MVWLRYVKVGKDTIGLGWARMVMGLASEHIRWMESDHQHPGKKYPTVCVLKGVIPLDRLKS